MPFQFPHQTTSTNAHEKERKVVELVEPRSRESSKLSARKSWVSLAWRRQIKCRAIWKLSAEIWTSSNVNVNVKRYLRAISQNELNLMHGEKMST